MPYSQISELPAAVKDNLPKGAQKIYMGAVNSSLKAGKDDATAAKIAWGAVKSKYRKAGDGKWVKKQFFKIGATPAYIQGPPLVAENLGGKIVKPKRTGLGNTASKK